MFHSSGTELEGERAAFERFVAGRAIVYLDTDAWIALSKGQDDGAKRCRQEATDAVRKGRLIFPLSYASCSEIVQQSPGDSRTVRIRLMQELSRGVAFRAISAVRKIEARAALPILLGEKPDQPDVTRIFSSIYECFSDAAELITGIDGSEKRPDFITWLRRTSRLMSLEDYVHVFDTIGGGSGSRQFFEDRAQTLLDSIPRAADACRNRDGALNRDKVFLQEALSCFTSIKPMLLAALHEQRPEGMKAIATLAQSDPGGPDRLRRLLEAMPSAANEVDLFVGRVMNPNRKHRIRNDFWDVEHAVVPAVYSNAWVTLDRGLASLVRSCNAPQQRGCRILLGMQEFKVFLTVSEPHSNS